MNKHLMQSIVDIACFLGSCDDEECDPDSAVELLETIAVNLRKLNSKQSVEFVKFCEKAAKNADDPEHAESIRELPIDLGLVESQED